MYPDVSMLVLTSKFDGQWRRAKVITGKARDKPEKKTISAPAPKIKEASTLDIN
jgi:hypothetical protein